MKEEAIDLTDFAFRRRLAGLGGSLLRIMGLDVGDRRIGVAVSDPLGITAQGLPTLERVSLKADVQALTEVAGAWDVGLIVAGLPRNMNGTRGAQSEKVEWLVGRLREAARVDVVYWDERLTTVAAHRSMLEGDLSRKKRKRAVDRVAAVLILQGYLGHRGSSGPIA